MQDVRPELSCYNYVNSWSSVFACRARCIRHAVRSCAGQIECCQTGECLTNVICRAFGCL